MKGKPTASYKLIADAGGNRYQFFCDLSGALACTTEPIRADTPEEALMIAWKREGRQHFNQCHKCGRWVSDVMYNADVMECVDCAPWENVPKFCPECGDPFDDGDMVRRKAEDLRASPSNCSLLSDACGLPWDRRHRCRNGHGHGDHRRDLRYRRTPGAGS